MSEKFINNRLTLIVLISACVVIMISMGLRQTFGLFFQAFEEGLGCTRTEFGLAIGIQMIFWGMFSPLFGLVADRFGGNKAVFIGFLIFGAGIFMLYSGPNTGIYFQISLGVLIGIALGATAISVPVSEVSKHFPNEKRTIASGLVTAAASVGYFIAPLFTKYSLGEFGWEETLKYFLYFILFGSLVSLFIFSPKKLTDQNQSVVKDQTFFEALKEAFSHKGYLLLNAGFFVCGFQITLIATHVPRYVQDKGLADWTGMAILALIGFFNIIGTLVMGYLGDKYSKKILLSGLYFLRGITLILFIFLPATNLSAILFGTSFGLLWLATVPATNGIVAQIFGTKNLTLLFGIVFLNHQFGSFLGAYLGCYFYDKFGGYDYAWYLAIVLSFIATALHLPIDEKPLQKATSTS